MTMDINKYRDTKYLKQEDVARPVLATIDHCEEQDVSIAGQPEKIRCVIFFKESIKPYIANWTTLQEIHRMTGSGDAETWGGTQLVLYQDKDIEFGSKKVGGIRVRPPKNQVEPDPPEEDEVPF